MDEAETLARRRAECAARQRRHNAKLISEQGFEAVASMRRMQRESSRAQPYVRHAQRGAQADVEACLAGMRQQATQMRKWQLHLALSPPPQLPLPQTTAR